MNENDGRKLIKTSGVIIRSSRNGVFSDLVTPGGGSVKVMSREVYNKASRAAGAAFKGAAQENSGRGAATGWIISDKAKDTAGGSLASVRVIAGKPFKGIWRGR